MWSLHPTPRVKTELRSAGGCAREVPRICDDRVNGPWVFRGDRGRLCELAVRGGSLALVRARAKRPGNCATDITNDELA
jgi:hypothetical protein